MRTTLHVITHASHLGQVIKSRRLAMRLTQKDLAAKLGITQARLSQLETDPGSLPVARLIPILSILDLELVAQKRTGPGTDW